LGQNYHRRRRNLLYGRRYLQFDRDRCYQEEIQGTFGFKTFGQLFFFLDSPSHLQCYLYVDEAHSIGALGKSGRGVCEHWGINPADVDILMGTFTKSFASVGGYIASSKQVIDVLRNRSFGQIYEPAMTFGTVQQIVSALGVIMGKDNTDLGRNKIQQLKDNSNFVRRQLIDKGFQVFGSPDSPIIPIMLYHPGKIPAFSRECLARNLAVVGVGYPATPLLLGRVRLCISASHSREDLEWAVQQLDELGDRCAAKYGTVDPRLVTTASGQKKDE